MMYDHLLASLLRWLRVPAEPLDPMGDVQSLRVFRAAPGYLRYMTFTWLVAQAAVLTGVAVLVTALLAGAIGDVVATAVVASLAVLAVLVFIAQAALSYFTIRLNYDTRWYKVTDRSLRIRSGVWNVHELTMTFANVQNITITQGPLERLFGISDVKVETAGGGGHSASHDKGEGLGASLHVGVFRGVDNPEEIRALMIERLRHARDTGLGDPDDVHGRQPQPAPGSALARSAASLRLLTDLRDEARALRRTAEAATAR